MDVLEGMGGRPEEVEAVDDYQEDPLAVRSYWVELGHHHHGD